MSPVQKLRYVGFCAVFYHRTDDPAISIYSCKLPLATFSVQDLDVGLRNLLEIPLLLHYLNKESLIEASRLHT